MQSKVSVVLDLLNDAAEKIENAQSVLGETDGLSGEERIELSKALSGTLLYVANNFQNALLAKHRGVCDY